MVTVKVTDLVSKAQTLLQDPTGTRWSQKELVGWLNDAYREIILFRPDANSESNTFSCTPGTRQVLTGEYPNALRLLDIVRNVAAGSNKGAVRIVDRQVLDDQFRAWHAQDESDSIEHFMFDSNLPKEFLVYPPASNKAKLEVVFSSIPAEHDENTDYTSSPETIRLVDSYANATLDYMLYRAYSKDAEYTANAERAMSHYQAMQQALGLKTQKDQSANPRSIAALAKAIAAEEERS